MSIIKKTIIVYLTVVLATLYPASSPRHYQPLLYTIMLDPAGDAKQTGRIIGDSLERALTFQFAQALQKTLEENLPCTVIITRTPGEIVYPLQNANFANRLPIDLYIRIHCYHAPNDKLSVSLYRFSYGDTFMAKTNALTMTRYDKAHLANYEKTTNYILHIKKILTDSYANHLSTNGTYAIPFAPLIGIQAPAIGIEINLIKQTDWQLYLAPISQSIQAALTA